MCESWNLFGVYAFTYLCLMKKLSEPFCRMISLKHDTVMLRDIIKTLVFVWEPKTAAA